MPIRTRRWNDPIQEGDGERILVCRYRPRALPKKDETWKRWEKDLGPSKDLHAAIYGKDGDPLDWAVFRERYVAEMQEQAEKIEILARRVQAGETITLLCSKS